MTRPLLDLAELQTLLDALCEETITAEQFRRLEELLLAHPEAEAYYVQYASLQADLVRHFGGAPAPAGAGAPAAVEPAPARQPAPPSPRRRGWRRLALESLAALAAGILLVVVLTGRRPSQRTESPQAEAVDNTVAVLLQAHKAEWDKTGMPTQAGAALPPGVLRLKSGYAHIEFYSGATVILEGPAEFRLVSRTEAFCTRGKLRATVPAHAQGFTIGSPKFDLVDRGTEFGLRVDGNQKAEVQVFQGKVELYDPGADRAAAKPKALTKGQAVRIDAPGAVEEIAPDPDAYLTARELAARTKKEIEARQQAWHAASELLRLDEKLLVYYTFQPEQAWNRTLPDQALTLTERRDGTIIGCNWGPGRWQGKSGLEFRSVSDRVRLMVPGTFESLTFLAWVRVDALPNGNNSLMMADGWSEGAVHWQIGDTGTLILGVRGPAAGKVNAHYHAEGAFAPERLKRWTHVVTVYDAGAGQVSHYIDGQLANQGPIVVDVLLRVGPAELGNWNATYGAKQPIRFFSGAMDEFALLARPLSATEVGKLYEETRPPW
jgi:hypothetical protein